MARSARLDTVGSWHHVMNRGIARRTMFETTADIRYFLSLLAREVRAGRIEVHAYCIMTTHFHLLVRSPRGELSAALQSVTLAYVRHFNRRRKRDGPLVRGRFLSRPVSTLRYRITLVRYIDDNPVAARIVPVPALYPHGSARHHNSPRGPRWLARNWIDEQRRTMTLPGEPLRSYEETFGPALTPGERWMVERSVNGAGRKKEKAYELFGDAPPQVKEWMARKAALADGTVPGQPIVDPDRLDRALARVDRQHGPWILHLSRKSCDGWRVARIGLLRELCGMSIEETARRCERSHQNTAKLLRLHRKLILQDPHYAQCLSLVALAFESE